MISGIKRQLIFVIPAFINIPKFLGLKGVWIAGPTADMLSVIVSAIFMFIEIKRINVKESTLQLEK